MASPTYKDIVQHVEYDGHNLVASHGDPGSIMNQLGIAEAGKGANTISDNGSGVFNYSYPLVNSAGILSIMGRVNNNNSLQSIYLTPKEVRRVIQHKDPGVPRAFATKKWPFS